MSVPVRALPRRPAPPRSPARPVGAALALVLLAGCGRFDTVDATLPAPLQPGRPAGTLVVAAGTDPAAAVQRVSDAVTAGGGTVTAVVDLAADARAAGVQLPPTSVVVGGSTAAQLALVRADQRAAANLPPHYLVRQSPDGTVGLLTDSADYVAAVSGVVAPDARVPLRDATAAVLAAAAPDGASATPSPLIGVTPVDHLVSAVGDAAVPVTVDRLRRAATGGVRVVGTVDVAAATDGGPPVRPTTTVLVSTPAAEARLLAAAPTFGVELPLRFVVWLDEQGRTQVGHPDVRALARRHGIAPDDPNITRMAADAERLAAVAAGTGQ